MVAGGTDILNVHGQVTDVMRIGWLAAELGIPVSLGNTFLEVGVHMACALPEVEWLEYSFQNFDHLVDEPMEIRDGWIHAPDRPGHGLVLSETARRDWARPEILPRDKLGDAARSTLGLTGVPGSQRAPDEAKATRPNGRNDVQKLKLMAAARGHAGGLACAGAGNHRLGRQRRRAAHADLLRCTPRPHSRPRIRAQRSPSCRSRTPSTTRCWARPSLPRPVRT